MIVVINIIGFTVSTHCVVAVIIDIIMNHYAYLHTYLFLCLLLSFISTSRSFDSSLASVNVAVVDFVPSSLSFIPSHPHALTCTRVHARRLRTRSGRPRRRRDSPCRRECPRIRRALTSDTLLAAYPLRIPFTSEVVGPKSKKRGRARARERACAPIKRRERAEIILMKISIFFFFSFFFYFSFISLVFLPFSIHSNKVQNLGNFFSMIFFSFQDLVSMRVRDVQSTNEHTKKARTEVERDTLEAPKEDTCVCILVKNPNISR